MKRKKSIIVPLGVTIVIVLALAAVGAWLYLQWQPEEEEPEPKSLTVIQLNTEEIKKITYTDFENTVSLKKKKGVWQRVKNPDFPLDQLQAESTVKAFAQITATDMVAEPESLPRYGLMNPMYAITLTDKHKNETVVKIGNMATASDYYLTADEGKTVYMVSGEIIRLLVFNEKDLLQKDLFPVINSTTLKSITITRNGKNIDVCPNESKEDPEKLVTYGSELSAIRLEDCVSYNTGKKKLKTYGLNEKSRREVTVVYEDSQTGVRTPQVFYMGKPFQEEGANYVYLQMAGSKMVYKVYLSGIQKLVGL